MKKRMLAIAAGALAALLLAVPGFAAGPRDANGDDLPDRWERQHQLPLNVDQARKNQDKDGLRNRGEFRRGTDPRDSDSDDDGVPDGDDADADGDGHAECDKPEGAGPPGGERPPHGPPPPPPAGEEPPPVE